MFNHITLTLAALALLSACSVKDDRFRCQAPVTLNAPDDAEYTEDRTRDTFVATGIVTVEDSTPIDISATLDRITTQLGLRTTDTRPAAVNSVRTTFSEGSKRFNPTSGLAIDTQSNFVNRIDLPAGAGTIMEVASLLLLKSDEVTVDVLLEALDAAGNTLCSTTVSDVPLQRNRTTVLTGSFYSPNASTSGLQVNNSYLPARTILF